MTRALAVAALFFAAPILSSALAPGVAHAEANIVLNVLDGAGEGFNDDTAADPVGDNEGTTLGELRFNAIRHAADLWEGLLDSDVDIVVDVSFDDLGCVGGAATLGQAASNSVFTAPAADGSGDTWLYPSALADMLAGSDLDPGQPDIVAQFNTRVDEAGCLPGTDWYYGFDADHGNDSDLVHVALHELGHGLGFATYADRITGAFAFDTLDAFSSQIRDLDEDEAWKNLTNGQRAASFGNSRGVVWDGEATKARADAVLHPGAPSITTDPATPGFIGNVTETNFGPRLVDSPVTADSVLAKPLNGCAAQSGVANKVVLMRPECHISSSVVAAQDAGALAVLIARAGNDSDPPIGIDEPNPAVVAIPSLAITLDDADALETALGSGDVEITLEGDSDVSVGATASGQVYLNASVPTGSSSISHLDPLARPSLLMEPIQTPHETLSVDLTVDILRDMGWGIACGDGVVDTFEQCDEGVDNSDGKGATCRTDCRLAGCGDGIKEKGEQCDDGPFNRNAADACRTDCTLPECGDAIWDSNEECDSGNFNDDEAPGACRTDCRSAHCGDGVVEPFREVCDEGKKNGKEGCSADCLKKLEVDAGAPKLPDPPDAGQPDAGVMIPPPMLDAGAPSLDGGPSVVDAGPVLDGSADDEDEGKKKKKDEGCGCSVPGQSRGGPSAPALWLLVVALGSRLRRRVRAAR